MRRHPFAAPLALLLFLVPTLSLGSAHAVPWVFKYDEFPEGLSEAAGIIDGGQFYTQPGFVRGEAFGQIYRPAPEMFPLQIVGFDIILAAPPYASGALTSNATIEIYSSESKTPDPGTSPVLAISTADLFNPATQDFGLPLQGGVGISVEFDLQSEDDRPPLITGGNIWLVVRFDDPAMSLSAEWGTLSCFQVEGLICGCQNVGTLHDSGIVEQANVIHHVSPIGACSGASMAWSYMEDVPALDTGFTIDGDVVMRLRADVADAPCVPDCQGRVCGNDSCGTATCGTCDAGLFCVDGACLSCQPDCLSKQCGDDGCGGSCGSCGPDQRCGDDHFCHDTCTPDCRERTCGDDGCGDTCGSCSADLACVDGRCQPTCAPACDGRVCGDDGCGGSCGTCGAGDTCEAGTCHRAPPPLAITAVSPNQGLADRSTAISVTGTGFVAGAQVKVGATDCRDEVVTGDGLVSATVPAMAVGNYAVIVINPDESVATLPNAFQVFPADVVTPPPPATSGGSDDGGCAGGSVAGGAAAPGLVALALLLAALARRRRRAEVSPPAK